MGSVLSLLATFENTGACPTCGCETVLPSNFARVRRENGGLFYCPNGHIQSYTTTEVDKLKKELEFANNRRIRAEQDREAAQQARETARKAEAIARGKLKAQSERVANGVCPCCHRSFTNLRRHMSTKHPAFTKDEEAK